MRADQPASVVGGAQAGDDAGLPVHPVLHPVQVKFRPPFPDQNALLLQADEIAARLLVDPPIMRVDLVRQVDLGAHHVQEVPLVGLRHDRRLGAAGHVERRRDDRLRLVGRWQPRAERDDGHDAA